MATEKDPPGRGQQSSTGSRASDQTQHQTQHQPPKKEPEPPKKEPERHPAQPPEAEPGVAQRDRQPQPDDPHAKPPPEEKVVNKDEAVQLFRSGHKLKKKGDPPEKWFMASRINNVLVLCVPVDEEIEKGVLDQELVLADEQPHQ